MREPQLSVKIDVVDFLQVLEEQSKWNKLVLGDICSIYYPSLNINIKAKIVEVEFDYEQSNINLTIANVQTVMNDKRKFIEDLYKSISTSTSFDMNSFKYDSAYQKSNEVQDILNNVWDSAKREIVSGVNQSVTVNERGVTITDSSDPNKFLRMMNGVIGMTGDGGNSFKTALTSSGIVAERLYGQIIAGENLTITTGNGDFIVDQNGVKITDLDLIITKSDNMSRIIENATDGIKIQKNTGTMSSPVWDDIFSVDTSGNLNFTGKFSAGSITSSSITGSTINGGSIAGTTITGSYITAKDTLQVGSSSDPKIKFIRENTLSNSTFLYTCEPDYPGTPQHADKLVIAVASDYGEKGQVKIDANYGVDLIVNGAVTANSFNGTVSYASSAGSTSSLSGTIIDMNYGYIESKSDGIRIHLDSSTYLYIGDAGCIVYVNGVETILA
jgi:hypothetical protein